MPAENFRALNLAESAVDDEGLSEPFEVLRTGEYPKRELTVTGEHLDAMVANFNKLSAAGIEFPTDWDHSFAEGGTSKASGWYRELVRKGKSLFARVKWTDEAAEQIKSHAFRFFSAEFSLDWEDEHGKGWGPTLLSGGLTNRPFLKGMTPVALSDRAREVVEEETRRLGELSGLEVGAQPRSERQGEMTEPKTVTLSEEDHQKLVDQSKEVEKLTERVDVLTEGLDKSKERSEELGKELLTERLSSLLSRARREGRIDAQDETTTKWNERAEKYGLDEVKSLLSELPAETIPVGERGVGTDKPEPASETPADTSPVAHAAEQRAKQLLSEREGLDEREAMEIAYRESLQEAIS